MEISVIKLSPKHHSIKNHKSRNHNYTVYILNIILKISLNKYQKSTNDPNFKTFLKIATALLFTSVIVDFCYTIVIFQ